MKQTETYKLNLIETSDPFSPEALNANAETLEKELARVDADAAAETARVNGEIARIDAALIDRPRIVWGTYVGDGAYGKTKPNKLDFTETLGCAPKLLFVIGNGSSCQLIAVNGMEYAATYEGINNTYVCPITWTETGLQWYNDMAIAPQMNDNNRTYYYVAFA